jgi:hypothetical protein
MATDSPFPVKKQFWRYGVFMNNDEIKHKVHSAMYHQCKARGYTTPVDVLMDIGILTRQKYEEWRFGRVPFLEAVCNGNLKKLSTVMHEIRSYAKEHHLKPHSAITNDGA